MPAGVATMVPTTSSIMPCSVKSRRSGMKMTAMKTAA